MHPPLFISSTTFCGKYPPLDPFFKLCPDRQTGSTCLLSDFTVNRCPKPPILALTSLF
jgi:hypothetical protein